MRFLHISDLHIGKKLIDKSLLDDQEFILKKIINIISKNKLEAAMIAGDIYDKSIPSSEAIELFDYFITKLAEKNIKVFMISGNHDSPERIGFGSYVFSKSNVFISPAYNGEIKMIPVEDEFGLINIYLLPFIKPSYVRDVYPDSSIENYSDALKNVIDNLEVDKKKRNIIIAHQYVGNAQKDGSEETSIGGLEIVDEKLFKDFDYVALGHIHKKQNIRKNIRYCGSPLQYAFSDKKEEKTVTIVDIGKKGSMIIKEIPLEPKRKLVELKGRFKELTSKKYISKQNLDDYYHITLTDEKDIVEGANKLRAIYPNLLKLDYENRRTNNKKIIKAVTEMESRTTIELFSDFFKLQNGTEMSKEQRNIMQGLIKEIEENWNETD